MDAIRTLIVACMLLTAAAPTAMARLGSPDEPGLPSDVNQGTPPGQSMGAITHTFYETSARDLSDPTCLFEPETSTDARALHTFEVPRRIRGEAVTGWRITTTLTTNDGVNTCVGIRAAEGGQVHRGHVGSWSTMGSFAPGAYTVEVGGRGEYEVGIIVELVTGHTERDLVGGLHERLPEI